LTQGIALILFAGLMWSATGILFSIAARRAIRISTLMGCFAFFILPLAWLSIPRHDVLFSAPVADLKTLVMLTLAAGMSAGSGAICLQKAMRLSHHGAVWTIGQSALVCPFLAGILIFHEPFQLHRGGGVALLLASLVAFGAAHSSGPGKTENPNGKTWFYLALMALLGLGIGQALFTVPSHYDGWRDVARLRVPLLYTGTAFVYMVFYLIKPKRPDRVTMLLAFAIAVNSIISTSIFTKGLDMLSAHDMVSIGYPVGVGTCIIGFATYSLFVLREKATRLHLAGMALGVLGIVLISF